ncbi:MAG: hypothetical protein WDW38_001568 [Sanguina aurantia]
MYVSKHADISYACGSPVTPSILADFSSPTGITGSPLILGEQDSPQKTSVITGFMQQGFTFERLGVAIYNVVPSNTTLADYKANVNNVQDPSTWNYGYLQKLTYFQQNVLGKKKCDMDVWYDIVMKISLYLNQFASVRYIEVWNEPGGPFLTIKQSPYANYTAAYTDIYYHTVQGTFRLMSSILGLGLGSSQIMRTIFNSAVITTTVAAINSAVEA